MVEHRRAPRFAMRLPMRLVRHQAETPNEPGETRNLSANGVLFTIRLPMMVGERIEYTIDLPSTNNGAVARIRCFGYVVRTENEPEQFAVAATVDRYEFVRE